MSDFFKLLSVSGKPLPSRHNNISIIFAYGELAVRKEYADISAATAELANITTLIKSGIRVPLPLFDSDNIILFTYEEGPTFEELLRYWERGKASNESIVTAMKALCSWFFTLYKCTGFLKGDVKPHNFIYLPERRFVGLDFEEPLTEGQFEFELGTLIAYIATCPPSLTRLKKQICLFILSQCLHEGYKVTEIRRSYMDKILEMGKMRPNYKKEAQMAIEFFNNLTSL